MKPYYEHGGIQIFHGDCREVLPQLPPCALLLTDPPYGSGLSVDYADRFSPATRPDWWRTSKDRKLSVRHTPIQGDDKPFDPSHLLSYSAQVKVLWGGNWYASRLPDSGAWWIWDKRNGKRDVSEAEWPMSEVEMAWTNKGKGARIFRHTWFGLIRDSEYGEFFHPTQKPAALMCWCIQRANVKGLIIDPYSGSGPTLVAAKALSLEAIGIEIEEKYCEIAAKRLSQEVLQFEEKA